MAAAKQLKRVSWAPDMRLRQVRLFLSEDAPSQSRLGTQDHLQAKGSWLQHSVAVGPDDSLPPGFEVLQPSYQLNISQIPLIKWQCPPRFALNAEWQVVAGEESKEVALQNQRLLGVLEAIYPRPSAIPPNPSVSSEVENFRHEDSLTPCIPITAIEDEDTPEQLDAVAPVEMSTEFQQSDLLKSSLEVGPPQDLPDLKFALKQPQCNVVPPSIQDLPCSVNPAITAPLVAEPDVVAAASAAFTAIMRSSEEGSLIDRDLLIKILSNPTLIEKLVSEYGMPKQSLPSVATTSVPPLPGLVSEYRNPQQTPSSTATTLPPPPPTHVSPTTSLPPQPALHAYPTTNVVRPPALSPQPPPVLQFPANNPPPKAPIVKDRNYFKSLIQLHGEERQESLDPNPMQFSHYQRQGSNFVGINGAEATNTGAIQRDQKPKLPKPCAYFNTQKGCRNGASCLYQHDVSFSQQIEQQKSSKRVKLDRGISGRI